MQRTSQERPAIKVSGSHKHRTEHIGLGLALDYAGQSRRTVKPSTPNLTRHMNPQTAGSLEHLASGGTPILLYLDPLILMHKAQLLSRLKGRSVGDPESDGGLFLIGDASERIRMGEPGPKRSPPTGAPKRDTQDQSQFGADGELNGLAVRFNFVPAAIRPWDNDSRRSQQ